MSQSPQQRVPPYVSATYSNNGVELSQSSPPPPPPLPPPAYQENNAPGNNSNNLPGQIYYQPPPQPVSYPPPPIQPEHSEQPARNRVAEFYSPQDNRKLALTRRVTSCFCCIIIIAIIVGLAAGLTRNRRNRYCECRTDADCIGLYGPGVYCYQNCDCGTRFY
ncbi:MAG: hypothetical protein EXX96DRAFT_565540 [Benjaminiella poitrasii]|nr:MAG: hypothetical protein EXX96DRAFT_565540 [Benjaminiella poitrasii]